MALKLMTYNCKGFNVSKIPFINYLLYQCDVLLLQETWLYSCQFHVFKQYFPKWASINVCGIDESVLQHGRPYGGCTILYRSFSHVPEKIWFKSKRICALKLKVYFGYLYIFNVYMPCDQHIFIDYYIDVLSEISHYCLSYNVQYLVIGGDLNTDISRINSANAITLKHFVSNECLQLAIESNMSSVTHTFISAINSHSLIDHFILPESLFDCIMIYKQVDSIYQIIYRFYFI